MRSRLFAAKSVVIAAALAAAAFVPAAQGVVLPTQNGAVVGAQTVGDSLFPDQGNGGYEVEHYDLAISWTPPNTIAASATITANTTGQPLSQFSLDLEGLTVTSVQVDGAAATFAREASGAKHKLVITPATPVEGEFSTVVAYGGTPVTHTDPDGSKEGWVSTPDGAVALNEPVGSMTWFPNNNTPRDKATFTTRLTVPYTAALPVGNVIGASTGVLASTTNTDTTRTFVWEQPNQQATYLAMVGIGQYAEATADVPLTTGSTKEWTYTDPSALGSPLLSTSRDKLSPILKDLEKYYGTYPGAATGLVLDVSSLGYALETQDRPYFENTIAESTLIHELAHQWFGNAVSPTDWSDLWLNEGPATYLSTQVAHNLNDDPSTQDTYYETWEESTDTSSMWTTPGAGFTDASKLFGAQVYTRGAVVLEALRSSLGDGVFTEVMATWIERYAGGDASTAEFIALAEEISGHDLDAFFADWLYDDDKPTTWPVAYELSLASAPTTGSTVDAGTHVDWTLTAQNSGKVPTGASVVSIDVADVVAAGSLDTLPAGVTRVGDTLEWAVPATAVGATSTVTVGAALDAPGPVEVTARGKTLGADCGTCRSTVTVRPRVISPAPDPTISGAARVGQLLTGSPGSWDPDAALSYRWLRAGEPVSGATGTTHRLTAADLGAPMSFEVTGSRAGHETAVRTATTARVARGVQTLRPSPRLVGVARVGRVLTARPGAHDTGVRVAYRWYVGGRPVAATNRPTFRLVRSHAGKRVWVVTTASKAGYISVVKASDRRPVVRRR